MTYTEFAYAKTNLLLSVGPKNKETNLHFLESIYARLSLADKLCVSITNSDPSDPTNFISISAVLSSAIRSHIESCGNDPDLTKKLLESESNLIFKAVKLFFESNELDERSFRIAIELTKEIPLQAGLGGGSADAASILDILSKHFDIPFSKNVTLAENLGADVLPCMMKDPSLELVNPKRIIKLNFPQKLSSLKVLIVKPVQNFNTAEAFRSLNRPYLEGDFIRSEIVNSYLEKASVYFEFNDDLFPKFDNVQNSNFDKMILNDFEDINFKMIPKLADAKTFLEEKGSERCFLSGSGSSLIALYDSSINVENLTVQFESTFGRSWFIKEANFVSN